MMYRLFFLLPLLWFSDNLPAQTMTSPDGKYSLSIQERPPLYLELRFGERELISVENISLTISGKSLSTGRGKIGPPTLHASTATPLVAIKNASVKDHYREVIVDYRNGIGWEIRLYDNGMAYRFTGLPAGSLDEEGVRSRILISPVEQLSKEPASTVAEVT
jgi:hypothetical protein